MKTRIITTLILLAAIAWGASGRAQRDEDDQYSEWIKGVREYKHKYLAKELDLSRDQQRKFFALYDQMEDEAVQLNNEVREMEERIYRQGDEATDADLDAATQAIFNLKTREGAIELNYLPKFKEILTKQQLFKLKGAERKVMREMIKYHRHRRGPRK